MRQLLVCLLALSLVLCLYSDVLIASSRWRDWLDAGTTTSFVRPDLPQLCPQVPPLLPKLHGKLWGALERWFSTQRFADRTAELLGGAVRIPCVPHWALSSTLRAEYAYMAHTGAQDGGVRRYGPCWRGPALGRLLPASSVSSAGISVDVCVNYVMHCGSVNKISLSHATLSLNKVNAYGLVYAWKGTDDTLKPLLLTAHQGPTNTPAYILHVTHVTVQT